MIYTAVSRFVRKIAINHAFSTYLAFRSDVSACPHALRAIPKSMRSIRKPQRRTFLPKQRRLMAALERDRV